MVPFSFELRKALIRYCKESNRGPDSLLFAIDWAVRPIRADRRGFEVIDSLTLSHTSESATPIRISVS